MVIFEFEGRFTYYKLVNNCERFLPSICGSTLDHYSIFLAKAFKMLVTTRDNFSCEMDIFKQRNVETPNGPKVALKNSSRTILISIFKGENELSPSSLTFKKR